MWAEHELIAADLLAEYGVDVDGPVMHKRSGPWLRRLVDGLMWNPDTRIARKLRHLHQQQAEPVKGGDDDGVLDR